MFTKKKVTLSVYVEREANIPDFFGSPVDSNEPFSIDWMWVESNNRLSHMIRQLPEQHCETQS